MRIISYNVNGIRSAIHKGFLEWLATDPADVVCVQETKAQQENVNCQPFEDLGYSHYWFSAQKKGYSGVAVFSKLRPDQVVYGDGNPLSDHEGRVIRLDFGSISLINTYIPSGTSGEERQQFKYAWLDTFQSFLDQLRQTRKNLIVCGDYNICHKPIDIHDPVGNKNSSGFLPEERAWMDRFFASGFVDSFRMFHPEPHQYSWWSMRANARANNKGWRIDYINPTESLSGALRDARIYPDVRHSDHCPVYLDLKS